MIKRSLISVALLFLLVGVVSAAEKFELKDVSVDYNAMMEISAVIGEITNNSGKNYKAAIFKISFYDENNKLIGACDFSINDFKKDETVTFEGMANKDISKYKTYKVRLNTGI